MNEQTTDYIRCPSCEGTGKSLGFAHGRKADGSPFSHAGELPCCVCHGWGDVESDYPERAAEGKRLTAARRAENKTQRERAAELGIDRAEYSRLENPSRRGGYKPGVAEECYGESIR